MANIVNELLIKDYAQSFGQARGMMILSVYAVTMKENEALRNDMAKSGVKLRVVRNSLARRVLADQGLTFGDDVFVGNVGIAYGTAEAAIHTAKLLLKPEVKKANKLKVKAGVLDGQILNAKDSLALADVPDMHTLRAQLVGCIQGPGRSLVSLLAANQGGLVRLMAAKNDQSAGGDPA